MEVSQEVLHELIKRFLNEYPTILFLMSHEDASGATVTLELERFKLAKDTPKEEGIPEVYRKAFDSEADKE